MTQLTQGSDMELRKIMLVIKADIQADPELYKSWKPFDDYEFALKQLIQRSIDRAVAEARINEVNELIVATGPAVNDAELHIQAMLEDRLEQLSPTTKKEEERDE